MPDDPTLDAFLNTLRRSTLLEAADVGRLAAAARATSARAFADALICAGELTHYQAEKLLEGRWQGLVLGPYGILAPLGRGGMGTAVYLARDRRLEAGKAALVALKVLPNRQAAAGPKLLARFRREMEMGRRVDDPNVVRALASGDSGGVHYLALEFVPGKTLRQLVVESGPFPVGDAARVFADVAAGLAHLHGRGLVHRDVKPTNVMVRPDGRAVLLDLGLAFAPGEPLPEDPAIAGGRGYIVGTMDYLAPEQARNAVEVGPLADLYGLGCSLFFALTGSLPYPAKTTKEKVRRHRSDPVPPLPNAPPEFARIVEKLMAKWPGNRPASAERVRELLLPWVAAPSAGGSVDAIAAVDAPGPDFVLWDVTPGEELPLADLAESDSGARPKGSSVDDDSAVGDASEGGELDTDSRADEESSVRAAPVSAVAAVVIFGGLMLGAMLLILLVAVLRQL